MLPPWLVVALYALGAGAAIPAGAALAMNEHIRPQWLENELRHGVIAFGAGALLAAVALVLVPEGLNALPLWGSASAFLAGGTGFMALDVALARRGARKAQTVAMLADFLPEAAALGAIAASGAGGGPALALLIALQNLPEGFNAYREAHDASGASRPRFAPFLGFAALGAVAGLAGYFLLAPFTAATGVVMLVAAGGILYLTFQDLAPQARLEQHWLPALGGVLGFLVGMVGHELLRMA